MTTLLWSFSQEFGPGGYTVRVILSRKGFDSQWGGYASPILPDGRMISLPIPDRDSPIRYADLPLPPFGSYLDVMRGLKETIRHGPDRRIPGPADECHLDPDIRAEVLPRHADWRPVFGQAGSARQHLTHHGIGPGDLFLFFGWFRITRLKAGRVVFDPSDHEGRHIVYGYLQIGEVVPLGPGDPDPDWMGPHPHRAASRRMNKTNTAYVGRDTLSWDPARPGAGAFSFNESLVLTRAGFSRSRWALPESLREIGLSFHSRESWRSDCFQSAAIGQEFVFDAHPAAEIWARGIIDRNAGPIAAKNGTA